MPRKGGKRRKSRTHIPVEGTGVVQKGGKVQPLAGASVKLPKSLVVRRGKIGRNVDFLVDDLRQLMLPYTASRLKERKTNSMKDYISAASPLGVTHILAVSQTDKGPTLRIGRLPSGPTLTFKLTRYALGHHIRQSQRKPVDPAPAYQTSPLVVLNNFDAGAESGESNRHLRIAALTFQAMFPTINVKTVKLAQCKRVLLVSYNAEDDTMEMRHYVIRTAAQGASRTVKKIVRSKIPNLSRTEDISELILGGSQGGSHSGAGYATSDSEGEDDDACVTLPDAPRRQSASGMQSVIKLSEIGPRMTLQLLKIEDGSFGGEVQYHKFIKRSQSEVESLQRSHEEKAELKEARRKQQEENVERKKKAAEEKERLKKERRAAREEKRKREAIGGTLMDTTEHDEYEAEDEMDTTVEKETAVEEQTNSVKERKSVRFATQPSKKQRKS